MPPSATSAVAAAALPLSRSLVAIPRRTLFCPVPASKRKYPLKKQLLVADYRKSILSTPAVILAQTPNLSEKEWDALRSALRQKGIGLRSVSNGVFGVAAETLSESTAKLVPHLQGHNAVFYQLPVLPPPSPDAPQKLAANFAAARKPRVPAQVEPPTIKDVIDNVVKAKKVQIVAGVLNGTYYDAKAIAHFSTLPSMAQLRAELVAVLGAPAQRLSSLLGQQQMSLVALLGQRVKDLEAPSAGEAAEAKPAA
ncbi:hypothetical protein BCR44DRAFT_64692 [Catenaria anguillulae PL171]|uniref:Ribosomal protein L10-domain-containing protein n=1 Tax=Catenaria anguillulae PL171 TaxID=765915 RepID=A0A1Y2H642_9FUNG|nr:hypothetical protein BCR44DRAFT_64692 [Catenaria anguillulae PL171]